MLFIATIIGILCAQLLDELSMSCRASKTPQPRLTAVAQKIFNKSGKEITDVRKLNYDDEIWVSYGEPFICPFCEYPLVGQQ
jgi:hypothetical protein